MPDLTRRLSALERQVERALAATEAGVSTLPSVDSLLDGVTVGLDNVFRVLGGEPEATAAVFETPLGFLARRWWRIDSDHIVVLTVSFKKSSAIVDGDSSLWVVQNLRNIVKVEGKRVPHTR
jgi:hypothetical protein